MEKMNYYPDFAPYTSELQTQVKAKPIIVEENIE